MASRPAVPRASIQRRYSEKPDGSDKIPDVTFDPDPVIEAYKKDVDRTLLRENLRLSIDARFANLQRLQQFAEELSAAGRAAAHDRLSRAHPDAR